MATGSEFYSFPRGALSEFSNFKGWPSGGSTADDAPTITNYTTTNTIVSVAIPINKSFLVIEAVGCGGNGGSSTNYSGGGQAGSFSYLKIPLFGMDGQLNIYVASSGSTASTTVTGIVAGRYVSIVCPPGASASGSTGGTSGTISTGGSVNRLGGVGGNGNGSSVGGGGGGAGNYDEAGGNGGANGGNGVSPGGGGGNNVIGNGGGGGGGGWLGPGGIVRGQITPTIGVSTFSNAGGNSNASDGGNGGDGGGGGGGKGSAGIAGVGGKGLVRLTIL